MLLNASGLKAEDALATEPSKVFRNKVDEHAKELSTAEVEGNKVGRRVVFQLGQAGNHGERARKTESKAGVVKSSLESRDLLGELGVAGLVEVPVDEPGAESVGLIRHNTIDNGDPMHTNSRPS